MNLKPTDGATDNLHAGDWPLSEDGFFVPAPLEVDRSNSMQAAACDLAAKISSAFSSIHGVYMRGSAIESTRQELSRDVDVIVILGGSDVDRQELDQVASRFWSVGTSGPRCDLERVRLDRIRQQPFSTVIQLVLAFRATLLAGSPVWYETPKVKADGMLATRCQASHRQLVTKHLEKASIAPQHYDSRFFVPWMQKKALRLGGILAMGLTGRFSRHPTRCSTLISETYPELTTLAARVAVDYISGRVDEAARDAAHCLFFALAERGDDLANSSDRQATCSIEVP
jgi:hypothetical protein